MQTQIVTAVVALLVGLGIGYVAFGAQTAPAGSHVMPDGTTMSDTMSDMTASLLGKTGPEFDKIFLEEMIVHHEGAVDMATLAMQNGSHPEVRQLGEAIIQAQTLEIDMMRGWLASWFTE
jgi:uncharacterized protein (DUF305 family)